MSLTFDAAGHLYCWNGKPVPNVTRVLEIASDWSKVAFDVLERARQEGEDMHRMVELHSKNDLDEEALPAWLQPRLAAYKRFIAETGFEIEASEARVYHSEMAYAGTADLFGTFAHVRIGGKQQRRTANLDLKRSFYMPRLIGLQTSAYSEAWRRMGNRMPDLRFALRLCEDGTYRLLPCEDRSDFYKFIACLQVHRLREEIAQ